MREKIVTSKADIGRKPRVLSGVTEGIHPVSMPYYIRKVLGITGSTAPDALLQLGQDRLDFARHIAREQPAGSNDWACARCHPESHILLEEFTCVVHRAIDIANQP